MGTSLTSQEMQEIEEFLRPRPKVKVKRNYPGLVILGILLGLLLTFSCLIGVSRVGAVGETTLEVSGTRARLELELNEEPTTDVVSYYEGASSELTRTVQWAENSGIFTAVVSDTREWTAFKVGGVYTSDVQSAFWSDAPNDETGWFARSLFTPTLTVSGTADLAWLEVWGIWGDEEIEFWELGQHAVLSPTWEEIAPDTYKLELDSSEEWEAFKVMTWPPTQVESQSPYWVAGQNVGWVVQVPNPWKLYFPLLLK